MMFLYVAITPDCHPHDFVRPSRPRRIDGSDNGELSVIVMRLGHESVVCLDDHTQ